MDNDFADALKDMENRSEAYIERHPIYTKTGRARRSIDIKDNIYFGSFPTITRKSLLYKTKVEYGNYTINHIFGCAHGCNYPCYARMMAQGYGKIKTYEQWLHPKIVGNSMELLDKEIPKFRDEIDFVHMSFTTDPFMYDSLHKRVFPQIKELTLKIIEKFNLNGIRTTVLTKGLYPEELTDKGRYGADNRYGITLVSLDDKFRKEFEPFSSPFKERINTLKYLHERGLKTWVSIEPYPTPNIAKQDLEKLIKKISFVDNLIFGKMNYNKAVNGYPENKGFYKECVNKIKDFCKEKGIAYHIKEGTPGNASHTKKIFSGCDLSVES